MTTRKETTPEDAITWLVNLARGHFQDRIKIIKTYYQEPIYAEAYLTLDGLDISIRVDIPMRGKV